MKLIETAEESKDNIKDILFDYFICSSGYEVRATFIAQNLAIKSDKRKVICFKNYENVGSRKANDDFYKENDFDFIIEDGDQSDNITDIFKELLTATKNEINIAIDYSSMTRVWYSAIVSFFNSLQLEKKY